MLAYAILALVAVIWWRGEVLTRAALAERVRAGDREYALRAREVTMMERLKAEPREPEPIPPDLMALVLAESEPFAQDDILKVIRQTYSETQDWNMARRAVGRAALRDPGTAGLGLN